VQAAELNILHAGERKRMPPGPDTHKRVHALCTAAAGPKYINGTSELGATGVGR